MDIPEPALGLLLMLETLTLYIYLAGGFTTRPGSVELDALRVRPACYLHMFIQG